MLLKLHISSIVGIDSKYPCYVSVTFRDQNFRTVIRRNVLNEFVEELFKWETKEEINEEELLIIQLVERGSFFCDKNLGRYNLCLSKVVNEGYQAINDYCINNEHMQIPLRIQFDVCYTHNDQSLLKKRSYFNICNLGACIGSYFWCGKSYAKAGPMPQLMEEEKEPEAVLFANGLKNKYGSMF